MSHASEGHGDFLQSTGPCGHCWPYNLLCVFDEDNACFVGILLQTWVTISLLCNNWGDSK